MTCMMLAAETGIGMRIRYARRELQGIENKSGTSPPGLGRHGDEGKKGCWSVSGIRKYLLGKE